MKKFVILDHSGTYAVIGGKTVIDCTVKSLSVYTESDNYAELVQLCQTLEDGQRYNDGVWHHYSTEKRAHAKRALNGRA